MDLPNFLTQWPSGEIVVTGHRIGLYSLMDLVERGFSSAEIREEFPTLDLELIGRVVEFHETHRAQVDAYVLSIALTLTSRSQRLGLAPRCSGIRRLMAERAASGKSPADA